jgi:diacylglycerol kinase (ATP)
VRDTRPFSAEDRLRSFGYAFRGVRYILRNQHNAWLHALATAAVVIAGIALRVSTTEWCLLVLAMMAVWTTEAINTALERLSDAVSPQEHPLVGQAKDIAAGAVLLAATGAAIIGIIVFGPRLIAALFQLP